MKRILTSILGVFLGFQVFAQSDIVALEYFIDEDPGVGNATSIPISTGPTLDITYTVPTSGMGLSNGLHIIGIRAQNADGIWSMMELRTFYIQPDVGVPDPPAEDIVAVEYFIGEDPGQGSATDLPVSQGQTLDFTDVLSTSGLPKGYHVVGVRGQNASGIWGMTEIRVFYVQNLDPVGGQTPADIVELEYFFDVDPGQGSATSISVTQGQVLDISEILASSGLPQGYHSVNIRAKNSNGIWGMAEKRTFYIQNLGSGGSGVVLIDKLEYFIDEDPGFGNGINIPITSGVALVDIASEILSTQGPLTIGEHKIVIRGQGVNGAWGFPELRTFDVDGDCPIADFSIDLACEDEELSITDLSSGILGEAIYTWFADGDSISNVEGDINYMFDHPGMHTISLRIENGAICTDSTGQEFEIKNKPFVAFHSQQTVIEDTSYFVVDTFNVGPDFFWNWDFESDATIDDNTAGNTKHVFPATGEYNTTISVTDSLGCSSQFMREVSVIDSLAADTVTLTETDTVVVNETDTVIVTDTVVIVTPVPLFQSSDICLGDSSIFTDFSTQADSASYAWDFNGDGIVDDSTTGSTNYYYSDAGTFQASLTLISNKDTVSYVEEIQVGPIPEADFSFSNGCADGNGISFSNQSIGSAQATYSWDFNSDNEVDSYSDSTVLYSYIEPGIYSVKLQVENNENCKDQIVKDVRVTEPPIALFTWTPTVDGTDASVLFENSSVEETAVSWDFGDGSSSEEFNPRHDYTDVKDRTFTVCITASNNCSQDTYCEDISFAVSGLLERSGFEIFPNPSRGYIQANLSALPPGHYKIEVFDLLGKQIRKYDYEIGNQNLRFFTINSLKRGRYLLQVTGKEFTGRAMFIVL